MLVYQRVSARQKGHWSHPESSRPVAPVVQVVSNPVEKYLPPGARRFGMSVNGRQAPQTTNAFWAVE